MFGCLKAYHASHCLTVLETHSSLVSLCVPIHIFLVLCKLREQCALREQSFMFNGKLRMYLTNIVDHPKQHEQKAFTTNDLSSNALWSRGSVIGPRWGEGKWLALRSLNGVQERLTRSQDKPWERSGHGSVLSSGSNVSNASYSFFKSYLLFCQSIPQNIYLPFLKRNIKTLCHVFPWMRVFTFCTSWKTKICLTWWSDIYSKWCFVQQEVNIRMVTIGPISDGHTEVKASTTWQRVLLCWACFIS